MPYFNLQITKGVIREQKEIVKRITEALVDVFVKEPEHIHIVIDEVDTDNGGYNSMLTSDYRKSY